MVMDWKSRESWGEESFFFWKSSLSLESYIPFKAFYNGSIEGRNESIFHFFSFIYTVIKKFLQGQINLALFQL